jgi:hypothetical protein
MQRYKKRMHFYRLWRKRVSILKAIMIQRIYRGYKGRIRATQQRIARDLFYSLSPYATLVQKTVRGYLTRISNVKVRNAIREMYIIRRKESLEGIAVRLQAIARYYLATKIVKQSREIYNRRNLNRNHAILLIQQLVRLFLAKLHLSKRKHQKVSMDDAKRIASLKIKVFCVDGMRRYKSKLSGAALKKFYREKWSSAEKIQSLYRGYRAREVAQHNRIELKVC